MDNVFALKGNICHAPRADALEIRDNAFVVCEGGACRGVFDELPEAFSGLRVVDCADNLIIPGLEIGRASCRERV